MLLPTESKHEKNRSLERFFPSVLSTQNSLYVKSFKYGLCYFSLLYAEKISELSQQVEHLCRELEMSKSSSKEEIARLKFAIEDKVGIKVEMT